MFDRSRRWLAASVVLVPVLAACSPDPIEVEVLPEEAQSCDDLIPTGEALAVQLLAALEAAPLDVITGDQPAEGDLAELLSKGEEFDVRSDALECDPAVLNAAIMERVGDDLEPNSLAGAILLEIMRNGAITTP
ncbi:MAG: hypothetical protein HKN91_17790 [Acidimicrobiia bacterium]|nr:hypothetical protein [Acidimicrobiia bacterium]